MKFISVTEHYGYCHERIGNGHLYVIYNIKNGKPNDVVAGMDKKETAIKECKYFEKLNKKTLIIWDEHMKGETNELYY